MLEVIATCMDDVRKILEGGGQRIELVSALSEGGLTPSRALVRNAVACAGPLPVMVMIRPHALGFVYGPDDLEIMREDLHTALECGAAGVVLGALTPEGALDRRAMDFLFSEPLRGEVTFHKALDQSSDVPLTLRQVADYPVSRVLTSGGRGGVLDNLETLKTLAGWGEKNGITVMAGGGIQLDNAAAVMEATGIREIHVGTAVRRSGRCLEPMDPLRVAQFRALCG